VDSDSASIALLAIKPRFAHAIIAGQKKVEFRKIRFTRPPQYIVLYASTPIQQVIAFCEVVQIEELTILGLWRKFRTDGGIDYREFLDYYGKRDRGYAIVVGSVWKLQRPVSLRHLYPRGSAPQSFRYLPSNAIVRLMKRQTLRSD
jgi:predicted transcriptional regulator